MYRRADSGIEDVAKGARELRMSLGGFVMGGRGLSVRLAGSGRREDLEGNKVQEYSRMAV